MSSYTGFSERAPFLAECCVIRGEEKKPAAAGFKHAVLLRCLKQLPVYSARALDWAQRATNSYGG